MSKVTDNYEFETEHPEVLLLRNALGTLDSRKQ